MCGKFTQMASWAEVVAFSQPLTAIPEDTPVTISTPMRVAKVLRVGEDGGREIVPMRWGFSKPENPAFKPDHMHARAETIDTRPTFADAFAERRGIVLVETFNEGEEQPGGKTKQWVIRPKDRKPIAIAVIWGEWQGESGAEATFVMVTTPPNPLIARITDRMPAILRQEDWALWLGEIDAPTAAAKGLLRMFDDEGAWEMTEQASSKSAKAAKTKPQMDMF
ncbi:MAG: SOS response-associated peptidase family protein [Hyphomonadaceae bacterium]